MGFQMGRVDHDCLDIPPRGRQLDQHPRKDAQSAPAHPSVIKRLGRAIFHRCIPPAQTIAIDEDNPT